jgi:membrane protein
MVIAKTVGAYLRGIWHRADEHNILFMAEALSFSTLICVIPLVLIGFAIGGMVLETSDFIFQVNHLIDIVVPYPENARFVKEIVATQVGEFSTYKNTAGVIGSLGILFASSALFSTIRSIFKTVYKSTRARSVVIGKLFDFAMIVILMVLFLTAATLLPIVEVVRHVAATSGLLRGVLLEGFTRIIMDIGTVAGVFLILFLIHRLVPVSRPSRGAAIAAAISTTILWFLAEQLFGAYISHVATLKRIYGAYVAAIVVIFWIYYTSVVFIIGAEIGQIYQERNPRTGRAGK